MTKRRGTIWAWLWRNRSYQRCLLHMRVLGVITIIWNVSPNNSLTICIHHIPSILIMLRCSLIIAKIVTNKVISSVICIKRSVLKIVKITPTPPIWVLKKTWSTSIVVQNMRTSSINKLLIRITLIWLCCC